MLKKVGGLIKSKTLAPPKKNQTKAQFATSITKLIAKATLMWNKFTSAQYKLKEAKKSAVSVFKNQKTE